MRVAIGSSSTQEIDAVKEAWRKFCRFLPGLPGEGDDPEFLHYDVRSLPASFPLSVDDLMRGARDRAENLILQFKRERTEADYYIGLQRGFHLVHSMGPRRLVFLQTWAYVTDGHRGMFGHSGGIMVPARVADPVIDRGIDLGIVLDRLGSELDSSSRQGLWSLLGKGVLVDKDSCVTAVLAAFAPFFNAAAYR